MRTLREAQRDVARQLPRSMRKRIAGVLPRRSLTWYRDWRTDAFLVSYPKCGRTWLRVMIGRAFQLHYGLPDDADLVELHRLAELDRRVPCVTVTHGDPGRWHGRAGIDADIARFRAKPTVFLVRDPRDVLVSLYHQRHGRRGGYRKELGEFVDEWRDGFATMLHFYDAWADEVSTRADLCVVRYEDLHVDGAVELTRVLDTIGVRGVAPDVIADAVEFTSFDHMHALEESGAFASEKLRPGRRDVADRYKTRRGKVGGHRDELTGDQIARLDRLVAASPGAARFGYG